MAQFNIANFKSVLDTRQVHRNSKFLVKFNVPLGLRSETPNFGLINVAQIDRELEYFADGATLPAIMMSLREVIRYGYGPVEKKPVAPVFQDITFSIINDGSSFNLQFFQFWLDYIVQFDARNGVGENSTTYEVRYKYDEDQPNYATDLNIFQFRQDGKPSHVLTLREAYPINIADIPLSWQDANNIQRIPITFTFVDWFNSAIFVPSSNTSANTPVDTSTPIEIP
jgi:hypothetical protein